MRSPAAFCRVISVSGNKKYKLAAGKTAKSILISCGARLAVFDIAELREVTAYDELELDTLGDRKTALFLIMSDTDDSFNFLISMCYTQLFNLLCEKADDVYTRQSAQAELERVFDAQYQLTLIEEVEVRYRTETRTDSEGNSYTVQVPYNYYILNVKLTSKPISSVASELLTPEQLEMYQVYRQTLGNKPLIFGGGSSDTSDSESLAGVEFVNGTRPGNQAVVDIAKSQVGNVGGQPYWSWYGFNSRVEWCACFVSWCYGQMGLSEPRFAACQSQGIPWFQSHGQWGGRDYANIAPGDAIFFDWDLDGSADHVGLVVGTDGSRVYTVEGNSGDACKIKSYSLTYECIKGYGLMNW